MSESSCSAEGFEQPEGEVLAVVDGDPIAALDERETATRPGLTVIPGPEWRVQCIRVEDVSQRPEGTGFTSFRMRDVLDARHMSALESATREEVIAAITRSEED